MDIIQSVNKIIGNTSIKEWVCRLLLTNNLLMVVSGLIAFIQTEYQLVSPIIPKSAIYEITRPYLYASFFASVFLAVSLWFYFYKQLTVVIVLQVLAIATYPICFRLFLTIS